MVELFQIGFFILLGNFRNWDQHAGFTFYLINQNLGIGYYYYALTFELVYNGFGFFM